MNLVVWKEADDLCVFTHQITRPFPADERYGITAQMRRSSQSVPTNIVEGNSRKTAKDKSNFFTIAAASLEELHYQFHLSFRLGYINQKIMTDAHDRIQRIAYLLSRLKAFVRQ